LLCSDETLLDGVFDHGLTESDFGRHARIVGHDLSAAGDVDGRHLVGILAQGGFDRVGRRDGIPANEKIMTVGVSAAGLDVDALAGLGILEGAQADLFGEPLRLGEVRHAAHLLNSSILAVKVGAESVVVGNVELVAFVDQQLVELARLRLDVQQIALIHLVAEQALVGGLLRLLRFQRLVGGALRLLALADALGAGDYRLLAGFCLLALRASSRIRFAIADCFFAFTGSLLLIATAGAEVPPSSDAGLG
jgi:hypothetical protein